MVICLNYGSANVMTGLLGSSSWVLVILHLQWHLPRYPYFSWSCRWFWQDITPNPDSKTLHSVHPLCHIPAVLRWWKTFCSFLYHAQRHTEMPSLSVESFEQSFLLGFLIFRWSFLGRGWGYMFFLLSNSPKLPRTFSGLALPALDSPRAWSRHEGPFSGIPPSLNFLLLWFPPFFPHPDYGFSLMICHFDSSTDL